MPNYQATPDVSYTYDDLTSSKSKLIKVSSDGSTTEYTAFDILGRVTAAKQTTEGGDAAGYSTGYTYNLSGALIEETYPSGRKVKNVLDNNGELSLLQSARCGVVNGVTATCSDPQGYFSYAKSFTYNASGAVTSMQLGNGRWESTTFNSRLQPTQIALGTVQNATDKLKLNYEYGATGLVNNGNVTKQTITVPGLAQPFVQSYTYDELNRIKTATETNNGVQTWTQVYGFDRYGNRNITSGTGVTNLTFNGSNNRITTSGYSFDNAGNTVADPSGKTYTYDAENKQTMVSNGSIGQYWYDGDGKRVKKYVPGTGETTIFVYDAAGKQIAEYSTIVASTNDAKVAYLTTDHLGTPRINTDQYGSVIARHDYHPFGEEIDGVGGRTTGLNYGSDTVRKQFTGYERDTETDLDFAQARMFNYSHGRFTSPDDFLNDTHVSDPQSWNLYIYVRNNPLRLTDPEGKKGEITSRYDKKTGVTTITITASFALYSVAGQNISRKELESYKKNLIDGIKAAFDGTYKDAKTGRSFVIETNISAAVFDSKEAATNARSDNLVEFSNDELKGAWAAVSGDETGSDLMQVVAGREGSPFESKDRIYQELFGHEFGHLLGLLDSEDKNSLMNASSFLPRLNSGEDFNKLFGGSPISSAEGPPIRIGQKYVQQTTLPISLGSIATSTAPSYEKRYAGISPPMDWISRVKK